MVQLNVDGRCARVGETSDRVDRHASNKIDEDSVLTIGVGQYAATVATCQVGDCAQHGGCGGRRVLNGRIWKNEATRGALDRPPNA